MQVTFQLNQADVDAFLLVARKRLRQAVWTAVLLWLVFRSLMISFEFWFGRRAPLRFDELGWMALAPLVITTAVPLIIGVVVYAIYAWMEKSQVRSSPWLGKTVTISVDNKGVSGKMGLGRGQIAWLDIVRVVETDSYFVVLGPSFGGFIIPKRAFDSPAQCAEFGAFIQQKWTQHRGVVSPITSA